MARIAALLFLAPALCAAAGADLDGDGLDDALEQALLERFLPVFRVSVQDCDVAPAEFAAGEAEPRAVSRNATIYGQAFQVSPPGKTGAFIELRFYHLWKQDCGRAGHALDAEHASALVRAESYNARAEDWRAAYWFAAAHESTVCDASNGARAASLGAEDKGAVVWVSMNKHASYLAPELCKWGCGGDRCEDDRPVLVQRVINIGERGKPMNGAVWAESRSWKLASKMTTVFHPWVLDELDRPKPDGTKPVNGSLPPVKAVILAGGSTLDAVGTGGRHTGAALDTANASTESALDTSLERTGKALGKATRAVGGFLGIKPKAKN